MNVFSDVNQSRNRNRNSNRIKIVIILILLCACAVAAAFLLRYNDSRSGKVPAEPEATEAQAEAEETEEWDETPNAVILAASDYQYDSHFKDPADTLRGLIRAVYADGKKPEALLFCGDYTNDARLHDYQLSPEEPIGEIRSIIGEEAPSIKSENTLFVQGNHDSLSESIAESGLHEYDEYLVYVLNTENDFPWKQGKVAGCHLKVARAASEMEKCFDKLIAEGETRPVIIAGHVPLHYTARTSSRHTTGDNLYSSLIVDVLNDAAMDLDIIYLFGHNHSKGWDCYLGGSCVFIEPGYDMLVPEFDDSDVNTDTYRKETIGFTYMNAGYVGYYMNCAPDEYSSDPDSPYRAADETLTCTVLEVYDERVEIFRYDENGKHLLGAAGEGNPYKGGIDADLIGPENYSRPTEEETDYLRKTQVDEAA